MNDKKNQHYVWQKYLEPWTSDNKIACLRNKKYIINTNTRNIASGRYFYKINNLTYNDCKLIRKVFIDNHQEPMKKTLEGWITPIEKALELYDKSIKYNGVIEDIKNNNDVVLKNILEELYANIENSAVLPLSKVQSGDFSFITESNYKNEFNVDFILFLSFQYFRTNKIKHSVKESVGELKDLFNDFDDAFNLIVPILATIFSNTIYNQIKNKELYCYYINNTTETYFITGDQPVINTKAKFLDETKQLELYYPVSPSGALIITEEKNFNTEWSMDRVKEYNDIIERQSLEFIFANDEANLKKYIVE